MIRKIFLAFLILIIHLKAIGKFNIGLCTTATNRYIKFVDPLIKSARKYFLKNHNVKFFVFTDSFLEHEDDTVIVYLKHKPWPFSTMQRFEAYYNSSEALKNMDYVFACDSDMLFLDTVSDEILKERVCVQHPLFWNNQTEAKNQFEDNPSSAAFVKKELRQNYFAGGFYGGSAQEFLKLVETTAKNIRIDLEKNLIAIWHDESHLNKYFVDNKPTLILEPSYCYPENHFKWIKDFPFKKILMALDKGNNEIRY
jgi:histo-blood group ABO system transferase